ncbi:MAG: isoprenylcysteine carboxylmethyltransferase family protein [Cyclobacteriaceae bacterium]|nr:isoprenylcysteine carboxylmethyltransferase family protein [Cyclobacteriaceae bacterium]
MYLWLVVLWLLYFVLHSFLANDKVKEFAMLRMKLNATIYRRFYVIFSTGAFVIVFLLGALQPAQYVLTPGNHFQYAGLFIAYWGIFILMRSFRAFNAKKFLGIHSTEKEYDKLVTSGIFSVVRHPVYLGTILLLTGFFLYTPTVSSLILVSVSILYIIIGIGLEEQKLIKYYGDSYIQYKKEVPMLIPKMKFKY